MNITAENSVGLVIDMQERLFPVMNEKESLLHSCQTFVKGLSALNIPILLTQQYSKGLGKTINEIESNIEAFNPIEKTTFSCLATVEFEKKLRDLNVKNVLISGIETHICVLQTAIDLKSNGYNPIIVLDATSSRNPKHIEIALERFRLEEILITSVESILFELTGSAKNPAFKTISSLVK